MSELKKAFVAALVGLVAVLYIGSTAHAAECTNTAYVAFQTSYPYQVTDAEGSVKSVLDGGATHSCGHWWFDASGPKDLSGKEPFGNELDLTAAYGSSVATPVGDIHYEALTSWWLLAKGSIAQLQLDVSRPFTFQDVTVTPYLRMTHLVGFGTYRDTDVAKTGLRIVIPFATHWSLSGDAGVADDFSNSVVEKRPDGTTVVTRGVVAKRFNGSVTYDFGDGLSMNAGVKLADRLKPAFVVGISKQL